MDSSEVDRARIIALSENTSMTVRQIAKCIGVHFSTVSRIIRRHRATGSWKADRKGKCGRNRITTKREDRKLVRESLKNPRLDAPTLKSNLCIKASVDTVKRRLREAGRVARKPKIKPLLTKTMKKKRLAWAKNHRYWLEEDWKKVIFTDESSFEVQLFSPRYVRQGNEPTTPAHVVQKPKFPQKVMIWGQMSSKGFGRIHIVEGTMTGARYREVLRNYLIPQAQEWFGSENWILQHDLAPCHTAKVAKEFIDCNGIRMLTWPANSPDASPIETVWAIVKKRLRSLNLTTRQDLINALLDICMRDTPARRQLSSTCEKLMNGMPKRIAAIIKAKGGHTKF